MSNGTHGISSPPALGFIRSMFRRFFCPNDSSSIYEGGVIRLFRTGYLKNRCGGCFWVFQWSAQVRIPPANHKAYNLPLVGNYRERDIQRAPPFTDPRRVSAGSAELMAFKWTSLAILDETTEHGNILRWHSMHRWAGGDCVALEPLWLRGISLQVD